MDTPGSGQSPVLPRGFAPTGMLGFPRGCQGDGRRCLKPTAGAEVGCYQEAVPGSAWGLWAHRDVPEHEVPSSFWLLAQNSPLPDWLPGCPAVSKQVVCKGFSMLAASGDTKSQGGGKLVAGDLHLGKNYDTVMQAWHV